MPSYCGFVCSDIVEKAQEIRKEIEEFAKYNPEESKVVLGNVLKALGLDNTKVLYTPIAK